MNFKWYIQRLSCMTFSEIPWRMYDKVIKSQWRGRRAQGHSTDLATLPTQNAVFGGGLSRFNPSEVSEQSLRKLLQSANEVVSGHWQVFNYIRKDMNPVPDWFLDPKTGLHSPNHSFAFDINHRNEADIGNVKYVWELSRHHHLTVLATAYYLTREPKYAECVARHLQSWLISNPFLSGIHWTSGIEIGIRLISWVWIRRLLDEWPGRHDLFEGNTMFLSHLYHHQEYLMTFPSRGSSANNHLLAEACGLFMASCSFPYFPESERWRTQSADILRREVPQQTFPSGVNKELATDYHGFVLELCLAAALEGEVTNNPLDDALWEVIQHMTDSLAAMVDVEIRPPRQGDSDDGIGVLLDAPSLDRWQSLLSTGQKLFGSCEWWPQISGGDIRTALFSSLCKRSLPIFARPDTKPALFPDAGMVILRGSHQHGEELWCRCDHGPHGFNRLAAHAHADALSIEIRIDGIEVLADPGTYCYHGEAQWRNYFRSTVAHNTLELFQHDQSESGGPFMWTRQAHAVLESLQYDDQGNITQWCARHDGYAGGKEKAIHTREVLLNKLDGLFSIHDSVMCRHNVAARLAFHLGPNIRCQDIKEGQVLLQWSNKGRQRQARLSLPESFKWQNVKGQCDPPLGWYSPSFDVKVPAHMFLGIASLHGNAQWVTTLKVE